MESITENKIKKVALSFLKSFYRFRPRAGETEISSDMRGAGGIIADGFLSYPQEDGSKYLATLEATSIETRDEVLYKVQKELLIWESIVFSLIITGMIFTWTFVKEIYTIKLLGTDWVVALLIGTFTLFLLIYRLLFSKLRRYRYIYAIEQFKQYFANDQWIAIGEDVFPDFNFDKHYMELRDQCIYNGFGLLIIDREFRPQLMVTPSREDKSVKARRSIQFISLNELTDRVQQGTYGDWIKRFNQGWQGVFYRKRGEGVLRFQRSYFHQMIISGLALAVIAGVFYKEYQERAIIYVDEEEYHDAMIETMVEDSPEPKFYLIDSAHVQPFEIGKSTISKPREVKKVNEGDIRRQAELKRKQKQAKNKKEPVKEKRPGIILPGEGEELITYDCERFFNFSTTKYVVEEGLYSELDRATKRMLNLAAAGVDVYCVWLGCFLDEEDRYALYLGPMLSTINEAERERLFYTRRLGLDTTSTNLNVRGLRPPK